MEFEGVNYNTEQTGSVNLEMIASQMELGFFWREGGYYIKEVVWLIFRRIYHLRLL